MTNHTWFKQCLFALICYSLTTVAESNNDQPLPDVSLPDLQGKSYSLRQWQGQKVLINFWATWCTPCRKEMPDLTHLQNELKQQKLQIIGIAIDDAVNVQTYLEKSPVNYPILLAPDLGSGLSLKLGNKMGVLPFSVFVNTDGTIDFTHIGVITKEMVKKWANQLTGSSK